MKEADFLHPTDWNRETDLSGWIATEKFNGCRACWDGETLWSRGGNPIMAPSWFTASLPNTPLDGEVWCGFNALEAARLAVQYGRFTPSARFVVFDLPTNARTDYLGRNADARWLLRRQRHVDVVKPTVIRDRAHLVSLVRAVKAHGGEGLVVRQPVGLYKPGRTKAAVKVFPYMVGL